ncbi:MAG TPA: hypothetical protein VG034_15545 [Acidimicrobiia bacterium]|jgi:hypothetical protein|nr:hypothetical protein [Acidimicrobiia bacterium]
MRIRRARFVVAATALATLAIVPVPGARAAGDDRPVTEKDFSVGRFDFRSSHKVDNTFLPLAPGLQYTLTGTTLAGKHEVVFTVTKVTKWVNHVRTLVLWDRDFQDGVLAEEELAFMAQDRDGNVWSLGEYPEEHADDGSISAPRTWLHGKQGATAGVLMREDPRPNTSSYLQGLAPAVEFIDQARVDKINQKTCVPVGCFTGVLVVDEFDPNNQPQDGHQFKFHAPGVGVVKIEGRGGVEQETLVLTKRRTLSPQELEASNARALQLDRRAYRLARPVYAKTAFARIR